MSDWHKARRRDLTKLADPATMLRRFLAKVAVGSDQNCWLWQAALKVKPGYGSVWDGCRQEFAHRVAYRLFKGPIPKGLTIDHLCRNPRCVNPEHLEAVTKRVNDLRGESVFARNARKTHCLRGHLYDAANTMRTKGGRQCLTCTTAARKRRTTRELERRRATRQAQLV